MVVTTLCKEAVPLVRYRTHDLASIVPGKCDCGLNFPRHSTILGRSDDMIIFRGVNIYPGQIMDVISHYEELGGEYQIQLTRDEESKDHMLLTVEREKGYTNGIDDGLKARLADELHKALFARVDVAVTDPGKLPRTFSKSKRVVDQR